TSLINSFGASAGTLAGGAVSASVAKSFVSAEADAIPTFLSRLGADAVTLPTDNPGWVDFAARAGYRGLLIAPDGASPEVLQAVAGFNARNAALRFFVTAVPRAASGAASFEAAQLFMQPANYIATGIDVAYQESQGLITQQQASKEMGSAFDGMLFN